MILLTGANGFVGRKIAKMCDGVVASPSIRGASEYDIRRIVDESGADVIVHTAAISDVAACAADPDASYHANVLIPVYLAKAAKGVKLICFSSDQVYTASDGEGPYTEDMAKPGNVYARHKLEMEERVLDIAPDSVMLRAEWMYDYSVFMGCPAKSEPGKEADNCRMSGQQIARGNYFTNMLGATEPVSFSSTFYRGVTYVKEVAENITKVCGLPGGAYNFGSETARSMHDLTKWFFEVLGKDIEVTDCAERHNLWIDCAKARRYGVTFRSVEDGLLECLKDMKESRTDCLQG